MSDKTPATYLSRTGSGYTVIHQGLPLTHDRATLSDCFAVASRMKLELPAQVWIGSLGRFGTLAEAKATEAAR